MSIPYLLAESLKGPTTARKRKRNSFLPQRLHQAFNPFDSSVKGDQNQYFRKYEGKQCDQVLWVHELWVVITNTGKAPCISINTD
jgi:hypothetical protein